MTMLGRYRLCGRPLGRGFQALAVMPAVDPRSKAKVAIKIYHPGREANELAVAGALSKHARSPFLIRMLDVFEAHTLRCLVMERGGRPLGDNDSCAPRPQSLAVQVTMNLVLALRDLHRLGYLYLDLHPQQVLVRRSDPDTVRLVDFGATVKLDADGRYRGALVPGCLPYCPPEKFTGAPARGGYDLYMAAAVGCYLLTGRPPFSRQTGARAIAERRRGPDLRGIADTDLARVLGRAMAFAPAARYRGESLLAALAPWAARR